MQPAFSQGGILTHIQDINPSIREHMTEAQQQNIIKARIYLIIYCCILFVFLMPIGPVLSIVEWG